MEFRVLGPLEVVENGLRLDIGGPKQRSVLALLVAKAGHQVSVGSLIDGVYGEDASDRAHRSIHTFVSNLRGIVGDVVAGQSDGYLLDGEDVSIDSAQFEDCIDASKSMDDPLEAAAVLRAGLELWRGHPFADVEARTEISAEITRLNELRLAALEARIDAELAAGSARELVGELEALTTEHPFREAFHGQHMLALYRAGRQAESLRAFARARDRLAEELGVEPSPNLRALEQRILEQDPELLLAPQSAVRRRAVLVVDLTDGAAEQLDGPDDRHRALIDLDTTVDGSIAVAEGTVAAQQGTATYSTFERVSDAIAAASAIARTAPRSGGAPMVRIGVDVGDVEQEPGGGVGGPAVIRAAGLVAAAHPGQVLLSADAQADAVADVVGGVAVRALGQHPIRRLESPETVHQLLVEGLPTKYPELLTGDPPELPTTQIATPGYELRDEIGSGLNGTVLRAYQPSMGREVAIRSIRPELANSADFIRRFAVEARMISDLEHPNVVPIYDFWRAPSGAMLVMRLMRGGSLAEWTKTRSLDRQTILRLVDQVGGALATAHRLGIAHGNLHASNVLLNDSEDFFLADFGIASDTVRRGEGVSQQLDVAAFASMILSLAPAGILDEEASALLASARAGEFTSATTWIEEWRHAFATSALSQTYTPTRNPYKGLAAFGELDAQDFHGRQQLTAELVSAVSANRLAAVIGPSGVGKSSVVRAGLLPELRRGAVAGSEQWLIADCLPGSHPFERLASALLRVASKAPDDLEDLLMSDERGLLKAVDRFLPGGAHLLLVVDQFEELFTLTLDPDVRQRFMDLLAETAADPTGRVRIIVTMRADFFDRPLRHPNFGELLRRGTVPASAPTDAEIREIAEAPAAAVGVSFEAGLVDRIVADVAGEIGALPLLEFALTQLFEGRDSDELKLVGYQSFGGVTAALGGRAEEVYAQLQPDQQRTCRQLFMRLVTPADDGRDTRRRVRVSELNRLGLAESLVDDVLAAFGGARLLTFDQDEVTRSATVEVAHEALLNEWPLLRTWLDTHREELVLRSRLDVAVNGWESADRADEYLLAGGHLAQHEAWTAESDLSLSTAELALLEASRTAEDQRVDRARRRRKRVLAGFSAIAFVASVLAAVAWQLRGDAVREQSLTSARELVLQAESLVEEDPELAIHLSLIAVELFDEAGEVPASAVDGLRQAVQADRVVARLPGTRFVDVSPDGSAYLTANSGSGVAVWDLSGATLIDSVEVDGGEVEAAAFTADGRRVYMKTWFPETKQMAMTHWDLDTGQVASIPGSTIGSGFDPEWLGMDPLTGLVAVQTGNGVVVMDESGVVVINIEGTTGPLEFKDDRVATLRFTNEQSLELIVVEASTGDEVSRFAQLPFPPESMSLSPDGGLIAISTSNGNLAVLDLVDGSVLWRVEIDVARKALWLDGGHRILVGGEAPYSLFEAVTGELVRRIPANQGPKFSYVAIPGTDRVLSAGSGEHDVLVVEVADRGEMFLRADIATNVQVSADGSHLLVHGPDDFAIAGLDSGSVIVEQVGEDSPPGWRSRSTVFSREGRFVAGSEPDGTGRIWSVPAFDVVFTAPTGWQIVGLSDDGSLAVIQLVEDGIEQETQVVRLSDGLALADITVGGEAWSAEFTPDRSHLLTNNNGAADPTMRIWRLRDGGSLVNSFGTIADLAGISPDLSRDGTKLVIGGYDGDLFVFDFAKLMAGDPAENALDARIPAHSGFSGATVSADGKLIATSAWDERVKIWDIESGRQLDELGNTRFKDWAFHPTLPLLYISQDGVVTGHTIGLSELLREAESALSRPMTDEECDLYLRRACEA